MYAEALEALLADLWPTTVVRTMEANVDPAPDTGWDRLMAAGFADLLLTQAADGPDLSLTEIHALLEVLGRHAAPLPLAATWVARRHLPAGIAAEGPLAVAPGTLGPKGALTCARVPGGRLAQQVLVCTDDGLRLLAAGDAQERQPVGDPRGQAQAMVWHQPQPAWQHERGGRTVQDWMAAATA
ncbi:MAG: hypothetical protein FGM55_02975, partial [Rhodoferax sp.]|nr:hypothetical protein [Rhodoferax sp.]